jgi:hypothetical protein
VQQLFGGTGEGKEAQMLLQMSGPQQLLVQGGAAPGVESLALPGVGAVGQQQGQGQHEVQTDLLQLLPLLGDREMGDLEMEQQQQGQGQDPHKMQTDLLPLLPLLGDRGLEGFEVEQQHQQQGQEQHEVQADLLQLLKDFSAGPELPSDLAAELGFDAEHEVLEHDPLPLPDDLPVVEDDHMEDLDNMDHDFVASWLSELDP